MTALTIFLGLFAGLVTAIPVFAVGRWLLYYIAAIALGLAYRFLTQTTYLLRFPDGVPHPDGHAPETIDPNHIGKVARHHFVLYWKMLTATAAVAGVIRKVVG